MADDLSKLTLVELLELLEPVPEPAAVSLMPQTAGWIWLGAIVAGAAAWGLHRCWRVYRSNAYRREARAAISEAGDDPVALSAIIRRSALAAYPRADVAGLYGEAWLAFLDRAYGGTGFQSGAGQALASAPYRSQAPVPGLADLAVAWVDRHRTSQGDRS